MNLHAAVCLVVCFPVLLSRSQILQRENNIKTSGVHLDLCLVPLSWTEEWTLLLGRNFSLIALYTQLYWWFLKNFPFLTNFWTCWKFPSDKDFEGIVCSINSSFKIKEVVIIISSICGVVERPWALESAWIIISTLLLSSYFQFGKVSGLPWASVSSKDDSED